MGNRHLFYTYYDILFAAKDYAGEVGAVLDHYAGHSLQPLTGILEMGCGTGNHTLELSRNPSVHVTAVDVDAEMLELARAKAEQAGRSNISFVLGRSDAANADLCVALFNVVNYICSDEGLRLFLADIAASLRPGGMFVFDCWNGTAALLDPPGSKDYEQQCGGQTVSCHLTSKTDVGRKITTLDYQLELSDSSGRKTGSGNFRIEHRLWTPGDLKAALCEAGFEVETVCLPFKFDRAATNSDWKIMFVCRKQGCF